MDKDAFLLAKRSQSTKYNVILVIGVCRFLYGENLEAVLPTALGSLWDCDTRPGGEPQEMHRAPCKWESAPKPWPQPEILCLCKICALFKPLVVCPSISLLPGCCCCLLPSITLPSQLHGRPSLQKPQEACTGTMFSVCCGGRERMQPSQQYV